MGACLVAAIALYAVGVGALGALLVFSASDWYSIDAAPGALAGQQLGGLIMWIPGGTVYLLAALAAVQRLLAPAASHERVQLSGA